MDFSQDSGTEAETSTKRSPFDNLSHSDLVKKCKNLLVIAQKAKQARDAGIEEIKLLKDDIKNFEQQRKSDKECLRTMQEMIDSLTEHKLKSTSDLDELKQKLLSLELKNDSLVKTNVLNKDKLLHLDNENLSLKRQISRLTDDNDKLLQELELLEISKLNEANHFQIDLEEKLETLLKENDLLKTEKRKLHEEINEITSEVELRTEETKGNLKNISKNEIEGSFNKNFVEQLQTELQDFKSQNVQLKLEIEKLHEKVNIQADESKVNPSPNSMKEHERNLEQLLERQKVENKSLVEKINQYICEISELNFKLTQIKISEQELRIENEKLQKKLGLTNLEFEENMKLIENLKIELDYQVNKLTTEKNEACCKAKKADNVVTQEQNNKSALELQVKDLNTTISNNNEKINKFKSQVIKLKQNLQIAFENNTKLQNEYDLRLKNIDELKHQLEESYNSKNQLEKLMNNLETKSKQLENNEIVEKDKTICVLQNDLSDIKSKLSASETEMSSLKMSYNELSQNYENLNKNKEKLLSKLKIYHHKLTEFSSSLKQLKADKNELLQIMKNYCKIISDWQIKIASISTQLCEKLIKYESENKSLQNKLLLIESEKQNVICEENINVLENLENENIKLTDQLQSVNAEQIDFLKSQLNDQVKENQFLANSNNDLLEKLQILSSDNSKMSEEVKKILEDKLKLEKSLQIANNNLAESNSLKSLNTSLKMDNENLLKELAESRSKDSVLEHIESDVCNLQQQLCNKSIENKELLNEMREINEVLKQRGETISKQQEYCGELEKKILSLENEIKLLVIKLNDKDTKLNDSNTKVLRNEQELKDQIILTDQTKNLIMEKDTFIESLQNEIIKLKDKLIYSDSQSDAISTSTISKSEEFSRLKDVESSLEERYTKMKMLASKYKKTVAEKCAQIAALETENKLLVSERNESFGKISSHAKNMQILQQECDKLQDEIEEEKKKNKASDKIISTLNDEITKIKFDFSSTNDKSSHSKSSSELSLEVANKEYNTNNLKKNLEDEKEKNKIMEGELKKLHEILKSKDVILNEQSNSIKLLKNELLENKKEIMKNSVLNLEIDNYEKTLNEMTKKLDARNAKIKELESAINSNSDTISSLKEQIKLLEANLESEVHHSKEIKDRLNNTQSSLNESEHKHSLQLSEITQLKNEIERLTSKVEELAIEYSKTVADKESIITNCKSEKDSLLRQTYDMENTISLLTENLSKCKSELMDIKTEFSSYKVRAQSVLKQNQFKDVSKEDEMLEDIKLLTLNNKALTTDLEQLRTKNDSLTREHNQAQEEKNKLQEHCNKLISVVEDIRAQHGLLLEANQNLNIEHQAAIKAQKLQNETLINCYKQQVTDLQEQNKKQLDNFKRQIDQMKGIKKSIKEKHNTEHKQLECHFATVQEENIVNIALMERGDGEGSESTYSISPTNASQKNKTLLNSKSNREIIPLDELLNSLIDFNVTEDSERATSPTTELQNVKKHLNMEQLRVKHLTSLLSENEQDLAKLTQLNEILKEEIRKIQRSEEREKHTQNSEYLKNVIFKFVTLNTGDEKCHLVPVLNMLLKLSPEETQKLQDIAKGVDSSAGRGWGNYLPRWTNNP